MKIEKFTGETTSAVMQQVRNAFGRDAVIISNRKTAAGVEILATDDLEALETVQPTDRLSEEAATRKSKASGNRRKESKKTEVAKTVKGKTQPAKVARKRSAGSPKTTSRNKKQDSEVVPIDESDSARIAISDEQIAMMENASGLEVQNQLFELRSMVEGLARTGALAGVGSTSEVRLSSRLISTGLGAALVRQLVESVSPVSRVDIAWLQALDLVKALLPVYLNEAGESDSDDLIEKGGTFIFHGRSGAGKTTALCKIAAQFMATGNASKLAIVSHRNGPFRRHGGVLESFSELLQVPVHYTETEHELHQALRGYRRKKLILVDTDALTDSTLTEPGGLVGSGLVRRNIEHCLVLPASLQSSSIDIQLSYLAETAIQTVVLSRLDETRQPGIAIEGLIRSGLKLRFCSDGPCLHEPMQTDVVEQLFHKIASLDSQPRRRSLPDAVSVAEMVGISPLDMDRTNVLKNASSS